jgi:hypothetical protein
MAAGRVWRMMSSRYFLVAGRISSIYSAVIARLDRAIQYSRDDSD